MTVSPPQRQLLKKTFLDEMKRTSSALHQSSLQLSFSARVKNKLQVGGIQKHSFWEGRISPRPPHA